MEFLPTKVVKAADDVTDAELLKLAREQEHFAIELYERQAHWLPIADLFDALLRITDVEVSHQTEFEDLFRKVSDLPYERVPKVLFHESLYTGLERLERVELGGELRGEALQVVINDHFQEVFASLHYGIAAEFADDPQVKDAFERTKASEDAHQRSFERLYETVRDGELRFICPFCGEILDARGKCWACGMNYTSLVAKGARERSA